MAKQIFVIKMNGDKAPYDENKLRNSMLRAGASDEAINRVLKKAKEFVYNGIKTKKLFRFVFSELKKEKGVAGIRYNLKNAIIDLHIRGAGYTFEKFMKRVFDKKGYETEINKTVNGKFITHEIDILARNKNETLMIEAKHHTRPWLGVDIKIALYVYARFLEVKKHFTKPELITNTKFSPQVINYSKGVGMNLMGWNYPRGDSLIENIEKYKIYPITILPMEKKKIEYYIRKGILTLDELKNEKDLPNELRKNINEILK
ncbi:MAG: restriction endonuclease [Candidatus Pacearchaeota archaeon]|jgi:hypothetical protein